MTLALAAPVVAEQPIHISAAAAEFDQAQGKAVYWGNVEVRQGALLVTGERLVVDYEDAKLRQISAKGRPARYQQTLDKGNGLVTATAEAIIYYAGRERIDLQGGARLVQGEHTVKGDRIGYDIAAETVVADATGQPVRVTLGALGKGADP